MEAGGAGACLLDHHALHDASSQMAAAVVVPKDREAAARSPMDGPGDLDAVDVFRRPRNREKAVVVAHVVRPGSHALEPLLDSRRRSCEHERRSRTEAGGHPMHRH